MVESINKEDIIKYWKFLNHKNQTEIRAIRPRWFECEPKARVKSIFISNAKQLVEEIEKLNGEYNIYIGINERKDRGTGDADVEFITNIGHDIDAHGTGDDGLIVAGQVAMKIIDSCKENGFKEPLIVNSGHGYWVIHHIPPIKNTEENAKKIREFGLRIKKKHEVEFINFDTAVYNPSRIARVAGTINVSEKDNPAMGLLMNNPSGEEDEKLRDAILEIELPKYTPNPLSTNNPSICSFMDYCLTHEIPKGERHRVISRNMAIYISDHPARELLKEQYTKIQGGSEGELDNWLKGIDEKGKDAFPFSIGELVNFTKKYKIPFNWKTTPEYKQFIQEKNAEKNLGAEIEKEKEAVRLNKAIKFFLDKKHLAEQFIKIQPLYYDAAKLWWIWNFNIKCWELCDETDIMNYISENSEADTISSTEKNEILEALKQVSRKNKPLPIPLTWIQFKNFIYDILTGEKIEVSNKYFVTNPIPWEIGELDTTPKMDEIFEQWVGAKNVRTLYEIIAYCLLNGYPIHRIFCFIGAGLNGKSKYLELLRKFVGDNNCCSTELDVLIASRFEVTRLHKKLVCQMGETNFGELSKTSLLKKLSGGDLIGFEYKNKNPFEDINKAKIIISTNNLPSTTDKTIGFYRRWMIIDFPNTFSEKKDILQDIPDWEYENLCLKSCKILKEVLNVREFTNEGTIEERMQKYEERSNFLQEFINTFTREDFNGFITKADFYKKFNGWCKENRHREMSETSVGLSMKKLGISEGRKHFDWLYDGKGGQARIWESISWK
jgi:P4 family phage/plasmid primase-like protien